MFLRDHVHSRERGQTETALPPEVYKCSCCLALCKGCSRRLRVSFLLILLCAQSFRVDAGEVLTLNSGQQTLVQTPVTAAQNLICAGLEMTRTDIDFLTVLN